jgi:hypothetical protein
MIGRPAVVALVMVNWARVPVLLSGAAFHVVVGGATEYPGEAREDVAWQSAEMSFSFRPKPST